MTSPFKGCLVSRRNWRHSLYFGEDNVNVGAGDVLAINDPTVFAQFGPVLSIQLLPRSFGVPVDSKLLKRYLEQLHVWSSLHNGEYLKQTMEKAEFAFQICDQRCEDKRTKRQLQDGIISS